MIEPGTIVDNRYKIQSVLGSGAFGTVYQAWQLQFDRIVALKTLNTTVLDETDGSARFEREARAISALKHKNTIAFYGFGVWDHTPYMVMEFVEGISLESVLHKQGRLVPEQAIDIAQQVCQALQCAHAHGIVHRDLKPSNVMIVQSPGLPATIKIIDFGLAKLMPGYGIPAQRLTEAGLAVGTCHYMSPEQCVGGETVDHRTDIYSLGCILYQMLVGQMPFAAEENVAVMFQHLNEEPPRLPEVGNDSRVQALQAILDNSLAKELTKRYSSAQQMCDDLTTIAGGNYNTLSAAGRNTKPSVIKQALTSLSLHKPRLPSFLMVSSIALAMAIAATVFLKAPDANPKSSPALYTKAQRLSRLEFTNPGSAADVLPAVEQAVEANRHDSLLTQQQHLALLRIAQRCYINTGQPQRAQATCSEAISMAPTNDKEGWSDWYYLARSRENIGDLKGAKSVFLASINEPNRSYQDVGRESLVLGLGQVLINLGELEEARRQLREQIEKHLGNPEHDSTCYYRLAETEFLLGNYQEARKLFQQAIKVLGSNPKAQLGLARCTINTSDPARRENIQPWLNRLELRKAMEHLTNAALLRVGMYAGLNQKTEAQDLLNKIVDGKYKVWSEFSEINRHDAHYTLQQLKQAGYTQMEASCRAYLEKTVPGITQPSPLKVKPDRADDKQPTERNMPPDRK